jgi:hypothetical protein
VSAQEQHDRAAVGGLALDLGQGAQALAGELLREQRQEVSTTGRPAKSS